MFNVLVYIGLTLIVLGMILIELVIVGILFIKFLPKSKITSWIRSHIITDVDLEPLKGNDL